MNRVAKGFSPLSAEIKMLIFTAKRLWKTPNLTLFGSENAS